MNTDIWVTRIQGKWEQEREREQEWKMGTEILLFIGFFTNEVHRTV